MTYLDDQCVICGKYYAIYGSDGFCDDCLMDGDDELQADIQEWIKSYA